jgi:NAD(P)-dependent dehydrogenase (short-subunit alcohol dehydrogenase family)
VAAGSIQISSYGGQATNAGASLYNASKWSIEGFMEALAKEVAAFDIGVTIVEPGGARTGFRSAAGSGLATPMDAYNNTPAAMVRGVTSALHPPIDDPARMVQTMIDSVEQSPAPRRLALGSDSYTYMHGALTERLAELEAQKDSAPTSDFPAGA